MEPDGSGRGRQLCRGCAQNSLEAAILLKEHYNVVALGQYTCSCEAAVVFDHGWQEQQFSER
eukprot:1139554-Pelagomonas_calceolata.AAC.2